MRRTHRATDETANHAVGAIIFAGLLRRRRASFGRSPEKTDENFVLNNLRLGAQRCSYDFDDRRKRVPLAYEVINSFGVNNGGRTVGALLVDEKIKIWKGEPYERAMANFYLGLHLLPAAAIMRTCGAFENALFKLRDYGEDERNPNEGRLSRSRKQLRRRIADARQMLAEAGSRGSGAARTSTERSRPRRACTTSRITTATCNQPVAGDRLRSWAAEGDGF